MVFDVRDPGVVNNEASIGTEAWSSLNNVKTSDDTDAIVSFGFPELSSNYLLTDFFGFNIPSTGTITGIEVIVENSNAGVSDVHHFQSRIVKNGSIGSQDRVITWPSSDTANTYGGSSDLWGETWVPSDINSSGFGFAIAVSGSLASPTIDHIQVNVHYIGPASPTTESGVFTLFMCGHENNNSRHQYTNIDFDDNKVGTSFRYSNDVNFDYGFWKINEGSGNVLYPINSADASGDWQHAYVGEPDWTQGMDSNSPINQFHIDYGGFSLGEDLDDIYQRAVRVGDESNTDKCFKFDTSAPTGDFTIFMALTHSGINTGSLLQYIDSGRPLDSTYADFRLFSLTNKYSFIVYNTDGSSKTAVVIPDGGQERFGFSNVRPLIAATYGGPNQEVTLYIADDDYHTSNPSGISFATTAVGNRRVVNSGALFLPGIHNAFGKTTNPAYYEEFGIANTHMTSGEVVNLFDSYIRRDLGSSRRNELLSQRRSTPINGLSTSGKGNIEFDVPNYSGYVQSNITFDARPDSDVFFRLNNNANALKINAFINNETNNPSGVEVTFGNTHIDWSGHPVILSSGEHFISVTGSFPNDKYVFNRLTGAILDTASSQFKGFFRHVDQGNDFYTANTKIYGIEVVYSGDYKPNAFNDNTTLYTFGVTGIPNSGIDLFVDGIVTQSGDVTLYTKGLVKDNDNTTLFTLAGFAQTQLPNMTMFIDGDPISSSTPLFVHGILSNNQSMNLYTKGTPPADSSGNIPLFLLPAASGQGAGFKTMPMFVKSFNNPFPTGTMNLFLSSPLTETFSITNTMNLFMKGLGDESGFQQKSNNTSLFINNDAIAHNSGIPMFIKQQTASNASGYVPVSGFMNLFISRQFEAVSHNFPMFINGPSGENNNLALFMQALPNNRSGVDMFIDGIGATSDSINLYNHGF